MESDIKEELLDDIEQVNESVNLTQDTYELNENGREDLNLSINGDNHNSSITDKENSNVNNIKPKRKRFKLEIDLDVGNTFDVEFDAFTDDNKVFRKYRLRPKKATTDVTIKDKKTSDDEYTEEYPCDRCKMSFNSKTGLLNHLRIHATPQKFTCSLCDTQFDTNNALIQHKEVHVSEKRSFICEQCKVAFSDHCDYLIHEASHMNRSSYNCTECGVKYTKRHIFQKHIKTHFDKKTICHICSKEVSDAWFEGHVRSHSYSTECVECGKVCKASSYSYHMTSHTGVKLHQCLYCGKGFAQAQHKLVHTRIHTDERPFECKVCNRWFRQTADLKRHMQSHNTEKDISCTLCTKKFYHKESLKQHMRVHLNEGMFTCNLCGDKFPSMTGLRAHTKYRHIDEKPFKCAACDVAFKDKLKLKRHNSSRRHKNKFYGFINKNDE